MSETAQRVLLTVLGVVLATVLGVVVDLRNSVDQIRTFQTALCADYRRHVASEHGDTFHLKCR